MRLSVIFGRAAEGGALQLVAGPGEPAEVNAAYKEALQAPRHFELQLWSSSGGLMKRKTFRREELVLEQKPLEDCTIPELREIAGLEGADLTGLTLKDEILAAILLNRTPIEERTVEQLRDLAGKEKIDLTGLKLKDDIVAAIKLALEEKAKTPAPDEEEDDDSEGPTL